MSLSIKFYAQSRGGDAFSCSGRYGAIGFSYPLLGHGSNNKQRMVYSVLDSLTRNSKLLDEAYWVEGFFSQLYYELNEGRLSKISEIGFSLTVLEPIAGGVRIGTIGTHFICMSWPDSGVGRLMHSDSIMEHPELMRSEVDDMWDVTMRQFDPCSNIQSLNWKTQLLTDGTAVLAVAPHQRIADLKELTTRHALSNATHQDICESLTVEAEGMCLVAAR